MHQLDKLIELCPPPELPLDCLTGSEWIAQFRRLGTRLPEQLVQLNLRYGTGHFESIQSPVNASFSLHCSAVSSYAISRLAELRLHKLKRPKAFPATLYFEPNGLLPIGQIGSGVDICLRVSGDNPDKWQISLLRATTNDVHHLNSSLLEFSAEVIAGSLQSPVFSRYLPTTKGYRFISCRESVQCWHAG